LPKPDWGYESSTSFAQRSVEVPWDCFEIAVQEVLKSKAPASAQEIQERIIETAIRQWTNGFACC
jgi:hypothetical protein